MGELLSGAGGRQFGWRRLAEQRQGMVQQRSNRVGVFRQGRRQILLGELLVQVRQLGDLRGRLQDPRGRRGGALLRLLALSRASPDDMGEALESMNDRIFIVRGIGRLEVVDVDVMCFLTLAAGILAVGLIAIEGSAYINFRS